MRYEQLSISDLFDDFTERTETADIVVDEKQDRHYGVPYQGNKSRIADAIIKILPSGKRLVDLFGGGGAITHCALLTDKWERYLYNDLNSNIVQLFMDAVNGKYADEKRVITREEFFTLKESDPYVKYIWSFGNAGRTYLWGKGIEEIKCEACRMLLADTVGERRTHYRKFIQLLTDSKSLDRLQPLERLQLLQSLQQLQSLQRLETSSISYEQYAYQDGDIVYCDIPYEQSGKKRCDDYGLIFDSYKFYEWAKSRPYQVYFSSYEISDNSFCRIQVKEIAQLMGANTNSKRQVEYLYSNKEIKT